MNGPYGSRTTSSLVARTTRGVTGGPWSSARGGGDPGRPVTGGRTSSSLPDLTNVFGTGTVRRVPSPPKDPRSPFQEGTLVVTLG